MKNYQFNRAKIKALMAEHGHTQADLALVLDVAMNSVSRKMIGKHPFNVDELTILANHYGVEPNYFFTLNVDKVSTENKHAEATLTH